MSDNYKLYGIFDDFDGTFAEPPWSETKELLGVYSSMKKALEAQERAKKSFHRCSEYGSNYLSSTEIEEPEKERLVEVDKDLFPQNVAESEAKGNYVHWRS